MSDEIHSRLGNIEGKLDIMLDQFEKHNERISFIEKAVYWAWGAGAVVISALGLYVIEIKQAVANIVTKGLH